MHDPVNHPDHYTRHPSGVECFEVARHLSFAAGNCLKYLWRADQKNGTEDYRKALWYLDQTTGGDAGSLERVDALALMVAESTPEAPLAPYLHWLATGATLYLIDTYDRVNETLNRKDET